MEHLAKASLSDQFPYLQLLERYVPLLQEDARLASLAREVACRQERQVHFLKLIARVLVVAFLILR